MRRVWWAAICLLGCGASGDEPVQAPLPAPAVRPKAATRALYGPQRTTRLTPFPSNRYTRPDPATPTGKRVMLSTETTGDVLITTFGAAAEQLNALDGFSTVGGVVVHFSGDIDPSSVQRAVEGFGGADAPLALIDVDPSSPERGRARGLLVKYYPTVPEEAGQAGDYALIAQPSTPLRPRTTYLFAVTDRVLDAAGAPVGPSDDMAEVLEGSSSGAYDDELRAALPQLGSATGIDKSHLALATLFTTETVHDETLSIAQTLRASPPPSLDGDITLEKMPTDPSDHRVRFRGRYLSPEWRRPKPLGTFEIGDDGKPVSQGDASLEFFVAFSDRTVSGPRPVVIFGHGLGSDKSVTWSTAGELEKLGAVVVGIDAPEHGSRASGDTGGDQLSVGMSFFAIDLAGKSFDAARARDNMRQMASDQIALVRLLSTTLKDLDVLPVGAPDGKPDLDPSRIVYLGQSFGAVLGPTAFALSPEIKGACWNVGGDGLTAMMRESGLFKLVLPSLKPPSATDGDMARLLSMAQAIVDPGDPLNYARFATQEQAPGLDGWVPRSVLLQEAVHDAVVPNYSTELLARALGLSQVGPVIVPIDGLPSSPAPLIGNLPGGGTGGLSQFDKVDGKTVEHGALLFSAEGKGQYIGFFEDVLSGGPALIRDPYVVH